MNTLKWELEDLAFATTHPRIYDEIVRLVAERAPSRDQFLAEVISQVERDLRAAKITARVTGRPKHYYSIYQKMIHGGREFSDIYDLVGIRILVDERPRLLRRAGRAAQPLEPAPGAVQGLRRDAEVQHVPVAAHHGDRPARQAGGDADPHGARCTGARSTASRRTGSTRRTRATATDRSPAEKSPDRLRHGVAAPAARLAERGRGPRRVPGLAALRDQLRRGVRLHPARRRDGPADRARRRSTSPTRSTPRSATTRSGPGSTAGWSRWSPRWSTATWSRCSPPSRPTPGPRRDWLTFVKSPRARSKIRHWFTKERREEAIEQGKEQIGRLLRKEGLPLKRVMTHESLTQVANELRLSRRLRALRRGRRGQPRCPDRRTQGGRGLRRQGRRRGGPRGGGHHHPAPPSHVDRRRTPGWWSRAPPTSW